MAMLNIQDECEKMMSLLYVWSSSNMYYEYIHVLSVGLSVGLASSAQECQISRYFNYPDRKLSS